MDTATAPAGTAVPGIEEVWQEVGVSFERVCLAAGIAALGERMERDAAKLCGARHRRDGGRRGQRWGRTTGRLGFHGGKVAIERQPVRARGGAET